MLSTREPYYKIYSQIFYEMGKTIDGLNTNLQYIGNELKEFFCPTNQINFYAVKNALKSAEYFKSGGYLRFGVDYYNMLGNCITKVKEIEKSFLILNAWLVQTENDRKIKEYLKSMLDGISRLFYLLNFPPSEFERRKNSFELMEVLEGCILEMRVVLRYYDIEVCVGNGSDDVKIQGSPLILAWVCTEVLRNSIEALQGSQQQKKTIVVYASFKDEILIITFCDNGPGIEEQYMENVFLGSFSTKPGYAGNSLYFSSLIIKEEFNGQLDISNTYPGTKLTLTFKPELCEN